MYKSQLEGIWKQCRQTYRLCIRWNASAAILMLKNHVPEYNPRNDVYKTVLDTNQDTP